MMSLCFREYRVYALVGLVAILLIGPVTVSAQESATAEEVDSAAPPEDGAAALAAKFQNPLASMKAIFTDNAIGFATGKDEDTSVGFQFQPVYAFDFPKKGFTLISRAVIPLLGLEPGASVPPVGNPTPPLQDSVWGLGDTALQLMYAPRLKSSWKWGIGPQFTLKTRTDSHLEGPGWGGGLVGIVVGSPAPNVSFQGIVGHIWGSNGEFSTTSIQPSVFYNFPSRPGLSVAYNAAITANWKADSSNTWTVPLGLSIGRTLAMSGGNGLDMTIGPYYNAVRPEGAAKWAIRFGVSWMFP